MAAIMAETCDNSPNKIYHKYWSASVGFLYIMDPIKARKIEHIKKTH
jgi:hypothetical protein